jgi:hypothetical protein
MVESTILNHFNQLKLDQVVVKRLPKQEFSEAGFVKVDLPKSKSSVECFCAEMTGITRI